MSNRVFKKMFYIGVMTLFAAAVIGLQGQAFAVEGSKKSTVSPKQVRKKGGTPGTAPDRSTPVDTSHIKSAAGDASPGQINAKSAVLLEVSTGSVLFEQNPDELIEPASFTKVLTLYLVFEALRRGNLQLHDEVWIGESAWRTGGSKMFVANGTRVPVEELLKGIAVVSGNDACVALAEHLYGSVDAFVAAMNQKAKDLGMTRSHFLNPHGLPAEGQVSTSRDMATLGAAYIRRFPDALRFHSMKEYTYNDITQYNRNHLLLKDPTVDGLKTGYVAAAGYHLAATANRDGMRLLAVVMGAATPRIREQEAMRLLNYGFRHFAMVKPFADNEPIAKVKVWKGTSDDVPIYASEAAVFVIPQTQKPSLRWEVNTVDEVTAPVVINQVLGDITFYVSNVPRRTISLVSQEDIGEAGWLKRLWHSVLRIHKIDWRWPLAIMAIVAALLSIGWLLVNRRSSFRRGR